MPDTSQASNQSSIQPSAQVVQVVDSASDCTPFTLNPAFISLELPMDVFKPSVGGNASAT